MPMTPDAKRALASTVRGLRESLLAELHQATESAYRLAVRAQDAGLDEAARARRARLEGWLAEEERAQPAKKKRRRGAEDFLREVEKQAASTWLNRLVVLRILEATGMRRLAVVSGGWESRGYRDFRALAPALRGDPSEGYALLLGLVFEELAVDLPGLFGAPGVAALVPMPPATLRGLVDALNDPALDSCWRDDMCLGWVYQYWNDPEREALDAKLHGGGKVEPHEIASKTQMFTERYMVDWLLQNSLGPMWLAMCKKHGWTPEAEATGTLARLEKRRAAWRARREAGEVSATALMPLETGLERRWAYYVPQPLPEEAVAGAPDSLRELKLLDPAVGSGHFLVVAFDLLRALYAEEARHRGLTEDPAWSPRACVERILEHNLHGIDLDPRAVQIAAAALWLKARQACPDARPRALSLVASQLRLAALPADDPALEALRRQVERETGISGALTDRLVGALAGADHLGSLLQVDAAVAAAIDAHEGELGPLDPQLELAFMEPRRQRVAPEQARLSLLERLEAFLARHSGADDLGLRLRGRQLAAGVRFVRMLRPGSYDLVVGNPPYQGTSKLAQAKYVKKHYPRGKADLYAAFLERGLQLVRPAGVSALLTMRNWMFIKQYAGLREWLLESFDLRVLGDFDRGAFEEVPDEVVSVVVSVFRREAPLAVESVALQPTPPDDRTRDSERTSRKRAAVSCQVGRFTFAVGALRVVPEWPVVYWWDRAQLEQYKSAALVLDCCPARFGLTTGDNDRFCRNVWEEVDFRTRSDSTAQRWVPLIHGARGLSWFDQTRFLIKWKWTGIEVKAKSEHQYGTVSKQIRNEDLYFRRGLAFSAIGSNFSVRVHRDPGVFSNAGLSLYPERLWEVAASLSRTVAARIACDIAPGIRFDVGDINKIPILAVKGANAIFDQLEGEFSRHESHREPSIEFLRPGPSPWRHAQDWAQAAVDRPEGAPLPPYEPEYDPEPPTDHLSFALGVALGRFGPAGEGILDPATADLSHALPAGILFLDGSLARGDRRDSLGQPASDALHEAWREHGPAIAKTDLRGWLRLKMFDDVHRTMYENRPIHWPLSSAKKTFVAWLTIHRWTEQTLAVLLADHLQPARTRLEGELADLRESRASDDKEAARKAEKRFAALQKLREELAAFIADVEQCAERGPPPTSPDAKKCPPRETDARYAPDLDDGVMINSAALWPLLQPQWKDPKKWWTQLAKAQGRKDFDWSHLAMRYWPTRVDAKCQKDPSLGVAHGCFWRYHPARAWAWELRLQDEIGPDFRIEEAPYRGDAGDRGHREAWLRDHPDEALEAVEKEILRRRGRGKDAAPVAALTLLEPGLWTARPEACHALELSIAEKQGAPFTLHAPDEGSARAAFEAAQPAAAEARRLLFASLAPEEDA